MPDRAPLYLIVGDDDHLLRRAADRVTTDLRAVAPDLDVDLLDAAETTHLPDLRTASLFGGTRCIVLRGIEAVSGDLKAELEDYAASPDPDATVVLVARGVGRIPKLTKLTTSSGERIDVKAPLPWDQRGWRGLAESEFAFHGRDADAAALSAVLERAGNDAAVIASKVAQVVAATEPGRRIGAEDVEGSVEGHGTRGPFAVADAVEARDPGTAIVGLRGALEAGDAPLALLGALASRIRQLLQVRGGATASEVGVSPGRHKMLARGARNFTPGELAWCHDRVARVDLDLKGSDLPADVLIEVAVIELATSREVGRPWNPLATN